MIVTHAFEASVEIAARRLRTMELSHATIDDAAAISELVSSVSRNFIATSLGPGGLSKLLASMDRDATEQRIREGWLHLLAIERHVLVGVIVVKPWTHLYHFFVRDDWRGRGIGRTLFESAEAWALERVGKRLQTVNSSLNAIGIYERLGFESSGPVIDLDGVRYQPMARAAPD